MERVESFEQTIKGCRGGLELLFGNLKETEVDIPAVGGKVRSKGPLFECAYLTLHQNMSESYQTQYFFIKSSRHLKFNLRVMYYRSLHQM